MSINISMFTTINHQYSCHANKTLNWLISDTEENYKENLETQYQRLSNNNWIDRTFTYKFNSHGFRCDEFTLDPSIMFLGCSHTCGIGIPFENTWAYSVSQQLNLNMINLGIGGAGPDTAFRLADHYIPQLKPKIVVYLEPDIARFSLFIRNKIIDFLPACESDYHSDYYMSWISNSENEKLNSRKHKLAIEAICIKNNIKYIEIDSIKNSFIKIDWARDLMHRGIKSNELFSKNVLNLIWKSHGESNPASQDENLMS